MGTSWSGKRDLSPKVEESRYRFRRLQHMMENVELIRNRTSHKIRHKKKLKKVVDKMSYNDGLRIKDPSKESGLIADYVNNKNQSVIMRNVSETVNYRGDVIVKEKLDLHEHCYTTNEVLEIIAVTCLVNFIFWFIIISCVNFYTKKEKVKYPSWESLESAGLASEYELRHARDKCDMTRSPGDEYVDEEEELENNCLIRCDGQKTSHVGSCRDAKWTILGNGTERELPPDRQKRRKSLVSSHSMENLIF